LTPNGRGKVSGLICLILFLNPSGRGGAKRVRVALSKRNSPVTALLQSKNFEFLSYEESYYYPDIDRMIMGLLL